jgi:CheY-like chemotaxis protein
VKDGPTLLLVDDDAVLRERLARALNERGYEVTTATTGEQALALAREESPELAVMDLKMPGLGGLALVQELKAMDATTQVVVLADCGGNVSEAARRLGLHRRSLQRKLHKHPRKVYAVAPTMHFRKRESCEPRRAERRVSRSPPVTSRASRSAKVTSLKSSHASLVSQREAIADLIVEAPRLRRTDATATSPSLGDLRGRFDEVLKTLEQIAGWQTERVQKPVLIVERRLRAGGGL